MRTIVLSPIKGQYQGAKSSLGHVLTAQYVYSGAFLRVASRMHMQQAHSAERDQKLMASQTGNLYTSLLLYTISLQAKAAGTG